MRKLILFFSGIILLGLMFGALVVTGAIYETGAKTTTEAYFFQPNDNFTRRIGVPARPIDFGPDKLREMLITKYITEFFYITPDSDAMARRAEGRTALRRMSSGAAFNKWRKTVAPVIEEMTSNRVLRTVSFLDAVPDGDEYWAVTYELKTWRTPNDFSVLPDVTRGTIWLDIEYSDGLRDTVANMSVSDYLESGGDPAAAFKFGVRDFAINDIDGAVQ